MDIKIFKKELLEKVYAPLAAMRECPVKTGGCTKLVFGEGNPDSKIIFIGEAPGRDEDSQGRPFVGRSGKLLNKCIENAGFKRTDVFITNIVKCRPPGNRKPFPSEIAFYKPILNSEIKIILPKIICTLGSSALESLVNKPFSMSKIRGQKLTFNNVSLIPTFHPAYILRNPPAENLLQKDLNKALSMAT